MATEGPQSRAREGNGSVSKSGPGPKSQYEVRGFRAMLRIDIGLCMALFD